MGADRIRAALWVRRSLDAAAALHVQLFQELRALHREQRAQEISMYRGGGNQGGELGVCARLFAQMCSYLTGMTHFSSTHSLSHAHAHDHTYACLCMRVCVYVRAHTPTGGDNRRDPCS